MKALSLHEMERFTRGGDPYNKLSIGLKSTIEKELDSLEYLDYTLDEDYNLTVDSDIETSESFLALQNVNTYVKNIIINGMVDLRTQTIDKLSNYIFPDKLTKITGRVRMFGIRGIIKLPDGINIGGALDVSDSAITRLPKNLYVGWDCILSNTKITKLPKNLKVGHNLYLENTPLAKKYPLTTKYFKDKYTKALWEKNIKIFGTIIV